MVPGGRGKSCSSISPRFWFLIRLSIVAKGKRERNFSWVSEIIAVENQYVPDLMITKIYYIKTRWLWCGLLLQIILFILCLFGNLLSLISNILFLFHFVVLCCVILCSILMNKVIGDWSDFILSFSLSPSLSLSPLSLQDWGIWGNWFLLLRERFFWILNFFKITSKSENFIHSKEIEIYNSMIINV